MTVGVLNNSQNRDIIQLSVSEYNELLQRLERLERIIMKQREAAIMEFSAVEDAFGMVRTKEKRVR